MVELSNIDIIELEKDYRFISFVDIGNDKEAMLLEHRVTRQLRFFSPCLNSQRNLTFVQLGL